MNRQEPVLCEQLFPDPLRVKLAQDTPPTALAMNARGARGRLGNSGSRPPALRRPGGPTNVPVTPFSTASTQPGIRVAPPRVR